MKLPFIVKDHIPLRPPRPIPISIEEADELKATIAQLNKEKEELQAILLKATQENCELKREGIRKDKIIESSNKRLSLEEDEKTQGARMFGWSNGYLHRSDPDSTLKPLNSYLHRFNVQSDFDYPNKLIAVDINLDVTFNLTKSHHARARTHTYCMIKFMKNIIYNYFKKKSLLLA